MSQKERNAFIDLGFLSSLRGVDSTGIVTVTRKKPKSPKLSIATHKQVLNPVVYFLKDEPLYHVNKPHVVCLMGHSRAATVGTVNETNAQPIELDKLVGMHNGTVSKYRPGKWKESDTTDSKLLYEAIEDEGLDKTLSGLWTKDAYALTFLDKEEGTINFVRNDERPLSFARTDRALFWASEQRMLDLALNRNGIEIKEIIVLKKETLFTYSFITRETWDRQIEAHKPLVTPRTMGFTPPKTTVGIPNVTVELSAWKSKQEIDYVKEFLDGLMKPGFKETEVPNEVEAPFCTSDSLLHSPDASYRMRINSREDWVSIPVAESYLRHGCHHCDFKSYPNDVVYWIKPSVHFCEDCMDKNLVKEYIRREGPVVKSDVYDFGLAFKGM